MGKIRRFVQVITGIHRIHHIIQAYGYKLPFVDVAYFDDYGWEKIMQFDGINCTSKIFYHNCTKTGIY